MNLFNYLDEANSSEYIWYKSDNIHSSVAIAQGDGTVNLKIVFNNGATYLYYKVDSIDYTQMKMAESTGKAFNLFIAKKVDGKAKYDYKRIGDSDITVLNKQMEDMREKAFAEAQQEQKEVTINPDIENSIPQKEEPSTTGTHKFEVKYDTVGNRMVAIVDGETVSYYPCPTSNDYARLALFLAPVVSHLGYPIKIGIGD